MFLLKSHLLKLLLVKCVLRLILIKCAGWKLSLSMADKTQSHLRRHVIKWKIDGSKEITFKCLWHVFHSPPKTFFIYLQIIPYRIFVFFSLKEVMTMQEKLFFSTLTHLPEIYVSLMHGKSVFFAEKIARWRNTLKNFSLCLKKL